VTPELRKVRAVKGAIKAAMNSSKDGAYFELQLGWGTRILEILAEYERNESILSGEDAQR
jgi:hypothetical protein